MPQFQSVRSQCFTVKSPRPPSYCPIHNPLSYLKYTGWANRPGSYDMNWPPPAGAHLLAPFDHQVAGQSSMLKYDESTVCKPLIIREHFTYQTLPECLREFTAEYRGELEVGLAEKDGVLQLYGLCVKDDCNDDLCQCSLRGNVPWEETLDVSKLGSGVSTSTINIAPDVGDQSRCVIRVLRSGSYEMCSPPGENKAVTPPNSIANTEAVQAPNLNPWSLKNHKRLLDKMRKGKHRQNSFRCILLKNVVADFKHPCILDLKIGSRLHGDEAPPDKIENQTKKCSETTSITLGVRLCGMQVFQKNTGQNINLDKYQGRLLTDKSFRETLARFLHNGVRYRSEFLQPIITKLSSLIERLGSVNTYRFYASSLLIIYDGLEGTSDGMSNQDLSGHISNQANRSSSSAASQDQNQTINGHVEMPGDVQNNHTSIESKRQSPSCVSSAQSNVNNLTNCDNQSRISDDSASSPSGPRVNSGTKSQPHTHSPSSHVSQAHEEDEKHAQNLNHFDSSPYSSSQSGNLNRSPAPNNSASTNTSHYPPHETPNKNTVSAQVFKVDVKMIDFAHTTHKDFPNDPCQHEGPDMDYIQGLTNLKTLFESLMAEC